MLKKLTSLFVAIAAVAMSVSAAEIEEGFVPLFDGKTLEGWKANNNADDFSIEDGAIKANGDCTHLFYVGEVNGAKFKDFELRLDVMTRKNSNGGFFIHSAWQDKGWPSGYEVQINNTQGDPLKSGSLYKVVDNLEPFEDDTWMQYVIRVEKGMVKVSINGKELVDHKTGEGSTKLLPDGGAFSIQAHDKGSTTLHKNIRVKVLE